MELRATKTSYHRAGWQSKFRTSTKAQKGMYQFKSVHYTKKRLIKWHKIVLLYKRLYKFYGNIVGISRRILNFEMWISGMSANGLMCIRSVDLLTRCVQQMENNVENRVLQVLDKVFVITIKNANSVLVYDKTQDWILICLNSHSLTIIFAPHNESPSTKMQNVSSPSFYLRISIRILHHIEPTASLYSCGQNLFTVNIYIIQMSDLYICACIKIYGLVLEFNVFFGG